MIVSEKSQFGIRGKVKLPFNILSPVQSQHLGGKTIMELTELQRILSKNGDKLSKEEMELVFNAIFAKLKVIVRQAINRKIPYSEREDAEQEFYVYILLEIVKYRADRLEDIEPIKKFEAFLRNRLMYFIKDYLRNLKNNQRFVSLNEHLNDESDQTLLDKFKSNLISPDDATIQSELKRILQEWLKELTTIQKRALILRYVEDREISEIADIEKVNENTVRQRIFQAKKSLARLLKNNDLL